MVSCLALRFAKFANRTFLCMRTLVWKELHIVKQFSKVSWWSHVCFSLAINRNVLRKTAALVSRITKTHTISNTHSLAIFAHCLTIDVLMTINARVIEVMALLESLLSFSRLFIWPIMVDNYDSLPTLYRISLGLAVCIEKRWQ